VWFRTSGFWRLAYLSCTVGSEITTPQEMTMSTKIEALVVATLLIASASTAFAQQAPGAGQNTPAAQSQDTGPFEHMSRPF
jgi:hypothetical protein